MMHKTKNRAAFTLIELLAAMAVLSIMMLMFANIFSSSGKAWTSGTRRTEQNMNGRAVLEYMGKEIGQSIVNASGIVFQVTYKTADLSKKSYLYDNSTLHCVSARGCDSATYPDEARLINYYVSSQTDANDNFTHYQLMRAECTDHNVISTVYKQATPSWLSGTSGQTGWSVSIFVDNITQFYVLANGNNANFKSSTVPVQLPSYVDILIGFLSEDDARKAQYLTGSAQTNFLNKAEKRFTRRVYMQNRTGYLPVP
jgi:prepilin-type N-terminal cleavage/methylation domain-containing protein